MIKAVVFDLGGVIVRLKGVSERYKELCKKYGKTGKSPWEDFRDDWNKAKIGKISNEEFYGTIANSLGAKYDEVRVVFISELVVDSEIKKLILALSMKYKIGILSNTIPDILKKVLQLWDFKKMAKVVVSCEDNVRKPDIEAIELIINKLGVEKDEIVFIDDYKDTVEKYREYGVNCVLFSVYQDKVEDLVRELNKFGIQL